MAPFETETGVRRWGGLPFEQRIKKRLEAIVACSRPFLSWRSRQPQVSILFRSWIGFKGFSNRLMVGWPSRNHVAHVLCSKDTRSLGRLGHPFALVGLECVGLNLFEEV